MIVEQILKVTACPIVDDKHRLTLTLFLFLTVGQFAFVNFDMIFVRQPSQSLHISHLLMLHNERYRVPSLAATKAVSHTACGRYVERWRLFVMERTKAFIVRARLFECDKFRNHVNNVGGIFNFFNSLMVYHTCKDNSFFVRFLCRKGKKVNLFKRYATAFTRLWWLYGGRRTHRMPFVVQIVLRPWYALLTAAVQ